MSDAGSEHTESKGDTFRRAMKEYVGLVDEIAEVRVTVNAKNKRKKALTEFIIAYMHDSGKNVCCVGQDSMVEMKKHKTTVTLKKEYVQELLSKILKDDAKAQESAEYIFDNKLTKETFKLHLGGI